MCVCVCVCTHTHKVRAKCSFLVLYRVAYSDTNLQRGSEEIKCLLSLATITIQAVYPRIIQVPLVQVTFFYSPPSPPPKKSKEMTVANITGCCDMDGSNIWFKVILNSPSYCVLRHQLRHSLAYCALVV